MNEMKKIKSTMKKIKSTTKAVLGIVWIAFFAIPAGILRNFWNWIR